MTGPLVGRLAGTRPARIAFLTAGHLCLALAVIGAFLPVMPTTVFVLGAAACYARGSGKLHGWLLANRWFGPPIHDWQEHGAMTVKSKVVAITMLLLGIGASVVFLVDVLWLRLVLGGTAVAVTALILLIRTRR